MKGTGNTYITAVFFLLICFGDNDLLLVLRLQGLSAGFCLRLSIYAHSSQGIANEYTYTLNTNIIALVI